MTVYQGPDPANPAGGNLSLAATGTKCDGRSLNATDILFAHTANGLSGISGTIYVPNDWALFNDELSRTATLAVITGCIFIDGATSEFNFTTGPQLFGKGIGLTE